MDPPPPPSSSSLPVCKFFLAGSCTKHDCKFLHDASTTSPFSNVCPFYKKGRENSCSYGDKCRYDHHFAPTPAAAAAVGSSSVPAVVGGGPASSSATTTTNTGSAGGAILSFATTMNTKAPSFIPTGGAGAGLYLSQQLQRTSLGAQAGGAGGVNAGGAWQNSSQSLEHLRRGGTTTTTTTTGMDEAEEYGGDGADDWGYEDEYGNWVSFNTGEGEDMADFVAAQLPDDDDLFLGMTASSGDLQEYQREDPQQQQQQHVAGGDGYGYFDQQGQWVNIEDPQSQAFLEQQYQLQQQQLQLQQQQQQQQHYHFQQHQQRQIPRDVNAMFRPPEEVNLSDHSYDQQRAFDMQIECSICLERVADESRPFSARRFGLLDKCDHSFCLSCIRGWRDGGVQGKEAGANATEQARMCPICRVNSFFITPSAHFPRTPEEKEEILKNYLSKMKQIPCKHYNNGRCPFGTSCFYSHGSGENDVAVRKTTTAGEELHILTTPTLADYLDVSKKVGGGGR